MHHIAIMNPKYFIDKILSGEKKIIYLKKMILMLMLF